MEHRSAFQPAFQAFRTARHSRLAASNDFPNGFRVGAGSAAINTLALDLAKDLAEGELRNPVVQLDLHRLRGLYVSTGSGNWTIRKAPTAPGLIGRTASLRSDRRRRWKGYKLRRHQVQCRRDPWLPRPEE